MSKTITTVLSTLAAGLFVSGSACADVTGNVGVTSNYLWRGVTQNDDRSAVQGGVDYEHDAGLYAGTWLSDLDGAYEHDVYAGFSGEAGALGYDLGVNHYMYPLADDADFTELYGSISYEMFTVGLAYTVNSDVQSDPTAAQPFMEGDLYYYAGAEFVLPDDFTLGLTVGAYTFDEDGEAGTDLDYMHYRIGLTKSAGDFGDFTFAFDQNDLDGVSNGKDNDDPRFSVAWTKSF